MIGTWWQAARQPWDKADFEELFLAHYESIYRLLFRILGSAEEAEDLAQETFLRLYRQRFVRRRQHNVRAWLYRVATNLAYNALRSRKRQEQRHVQVAYGEVLNDQGTDPTEALLRRDERALVRQILAMLPQRQARLLLLYYAGLSYRELADTFGVAPGSIGTLLARARTAFEDKYRAVALARGGKPHEM